MIDVSNEKVLALMLRYPYGVTAAERIKVLGFAKGWMNALGENCRNWVLLFNDDLLEQVLSNFLCSVNSYKGHTISMASYLLSGELHYLANLSAPLLIAQKEAFNRAREATRLEPSPANQEALKSVEKTYDGLLHELSCRDINISDEFFNTKRAIIADNFKQTAYTHYQIQVKGNQLHLAAAYFAAQSLAQISVHSHHLDSLYTESSKEYFTPVDQIRREMIDLLLAVAKKDPKGLYKFYQAHKNLTKESRPFLLMTLSSVAHKLPFPPNKKPNFVSLAERSEKKQLPLFPHMPHALAKIKAQIELNLLSSLGPLGVSNKVGPMAWHGHMFSFLSVFDQVKVRHLLSRSARNDITAALALRSSALAASVVMPAPSSGGSDSQQPAASSVPSSGK